MLVVAHPWLVVSFLREVFDAELLRAAEVRTARITRDRCCCSVGGGGSGISRVGVRLCGGAYRVFFAYGCHHVFHGGVGHCLTSAFKVDEPPASFFQDGLVVVFSHGKHVAA